MLGIRAYRQQILASTRRLVPFQADRETIKQMTATFTLLMGKGEAAGRRAWMEKDGGLVEADV